MASLALALVAVHCSPAPSAETGGSGGSSGASAVPGGSSGASAAPGGSASSVAGSSGALGGAASTGGAGPRGSGGGGSSGSAAGGSGSGSGGAPSSGGSASDSAPDAAQLGEIKLASNGLTLVSYGGYLNGESFQQEGIITHQGYEYTAYWNSARHVVLARRKLPDGGWATLEFSDYTNSESDAHNTISLGVSAADGVLHLAFDHHSSPLHYRHSMPGFVSEPDSAAFEAASFGAVTSSLVAGANVSDLTYPRFVSEPGGQKVLFSARLGTSGSGDEYLWEYDSASHAWSSLGKYLDGVTDNVNAYPHGLSYAPGGKRLYITWCWRETSNASTNHDLLYLYSDDDGRTWLDNAGTSVVTTGSKPARVASPGIVVWKITQNRGLINQEHMAVDSLGRVHVLLSHLADAQADDSNFDSARGKSQYFHYFRASDGKWSRTALGQPSVLSFRGKLAVAASGNLYAILPDLRILAATPAANFSDWSLLVKGQPARFFSDPLIDSSRLLTDDTLSVFYPEKSSPNIYVVDFSLK